MSVSVRRLEERDKSAWLGLFKGYIEFYKATLTDDVIEATWQRLMAAPADFHIALVAVNAADQPVGLAHVLFHRSTWSPTQYCYLEDLFVDSSQRLKGVGRMLIEAVYGRLTRASARAPTGRPRNSIIGRALLRPGGNKVAVHSISPVSRCQTCGFDALTRHLELTLPKGVRPAV